MNLPNNVTNIPLQELRKILPGERRFWPGSLAIKLIVRTRREAASTSSCLGLLGMTEREYKQYWTQQVVRGEAQTQPIMLATNEMQMDAVMPSSGAIAPDECARSRTDRDGSDRG